MNNKIYAYLYNIYIILYFLTLSLTCFYVAYSKEIKSGYIFGGIILSVPVIITCLFIKKIINNDSIVKNRKKRVEIIGNIVVNTILIIEFIILMKTNNNLKIFYQVGIVLLISNYIETILNIRYGLRVKEENLVVNNFEDSN